MWCILVWLLYVVIEIWWFYVILFFHFYVICDVLYVIIMVFIALLVLILTVFVFIVMVFVLLWLFRNLTPNVHHFDAHHYVSNRLYTALCWSSWWPYSPTPTVFYFSAHSNTIKMINIIISLESIRITANLTHLSYYHRLYNTLILPHLPFNYLSLSPLNKIWHQNDHHLDDQKFISNTGPLPYEGNIYIRHKDHNHQNYDQQWLLYA